MIKHLKVYFSIFIGVLCVAVAYYFLFSPLNIVVGGVTGITIILSKIFSDNNFSSGLSIFVLNMMFLVLGLIFLGKDFFLKTLFSSILFPLVIVLFEVLNIQSNILFTMDRNVLNVATTEMNYISQIILAVIPGSILTGVGLGLCFRKNATTGGMDIMQKILVKYLHIPYSKTIYITDGIVVLVALVVFGIEMSMYNLISIYLIGIFIIFGLCPNIKTTRCACVTRCSFVRC